MMKFVTFLLVFVFATSFALAATLDFQGSYGNFSASSAFVNNGSTLLVTLSNTSDFDVMAQGSLLTALFFNGGEGLIPVSAYLAPGSSVLFGATDPGGVVSGEWAFRCGLTGAPASCVISSAGFGLVGPPDLFPGGTNLQGPDSPDGAQYGITSFGDNPLTGNTAVTGSSALIKNSVVFQFATTSAFQLDKVGSVYFQNGTSLGEPGYPADSVPEPTTFLLVGTVLIGLGLPGRRRRPVGK